MTVRASAAVMTTTETATRPITRSVSARGRSARAQRTSSLNLLSGATQRQFAPAQAPYRHTTHCLPGWVLTRPPTFHFQQDVEDMCRKMETRAKAMIALEEAQVVNRTKV